MSGGDGVASSAAGREAVTVAIPNEISIDKGGTCVERVAAGSRRGGA